MGILDFVDNKHAGIIPRALAQVFESVGNENNQAGTVMYRVNDFKLYYLVLMEETLILIICTFEYVFVVCKHEDVSITVTLSFLQLYRETIQDLLAPATQQAFSNHDDNGKLFVRLHISLNINACNFVQEHFKCAKILVVASM